MKRFWFALLMLLCSFPFAAVNVGAETLTEPKAEALVREYVLVNGPWKTENVEIRVLPFPAAPQYPAGARLRVIKPAKGVAPGPQNFLIAADAGGKEVARFWARADVRVFDEVLVTAYPLSHREMLTPDKLQLERRDISALPSRPFTRLEDVDGLQTARALEVNEVLTQKSVERPTVLKRGSAVVLVYETGSLRVEAPGVAEEGGRTGDLIQVKNPSSGKLLRGLVLDGRTVKVN